MIARVWSARAASEEAPRYAAHLKDAVLPVVQQIPGYLGATLLESNASRASSASRAEGGTKDEVEIVVVTWWRSEDDVRAFAGENIGRAVVSAEARALLTQFDDTVRHFEVTFEDRSRLTS